MCLVPILLRAATSTNFVQSTPEPLSVRLAPGLHHPERSDLAGLRRAIESCQRGSGRTAVPAAAQLLVHDLS